MKKNALQNVLNGVGAALVASACVAAFAVEETTNVKVDVVFNGDDVVGYVDSNGKFHGVADPAKLADGQTQNDDETDDGQTQNDDETDDDGQTQNDDETDDGQTQNDDETDDDGQTQNDVETDDDGQDDPAPIAVAVPTSDLEEADVHPLADPDFLYRVEPNVYDRKAKKWRTCEPTFDDEGGCRVTIRSGEQYFLRLKNMSDEPIVFRLLVDGFNTLSQEVDGEYRFAPEIELDEATAWVASANSECGVAGFYADREKLQNSGSANPAETKGAVPAKKSGEFYKAFVASNKKSLAATRGKMDQAGVIRVGVYRWIDPNAEEEFELAAMPVPEPARRTRGSEGFAKGGGAPIATDAVGETERKLKKKRGEIGEKIAEFTIEYGEPPILR